MRWTLPCCSRQGLRGYAFLTCITLLARIVREDVLRRTYGNANDFAAVCRESLEMRPCDVVRMYIHLWTTAVAFGLPGAAFKWIGLATAARRCSWR